MLTIPFLTKIDPRGAVKGSRDPLGVQAIWTRFGRHVVGNLTTVSTSVRDFTTLLLGYYFAEVLAAEAPGSELATFIKWEQIAGYARARVHQDRFRGVERVEKALSEGTKVSISDDQASQILASQKTYGLWGLYTVAGKSSGLLEGEPTRLTHAGRELVDVYVRQLEQAGGVRVTKRIVDILRQRLTKIDVAGADGATIAAVANVLRPRLGAKERDVFRSHLLFGGPDDGTEGRQRLLAGLLAASTRDDAFVWSPQFVEELETRAVALGGVGDSLADRLRRIRACEAVIAPSAALFVHLLGMDGKAVADAVERVGKCWGPRAPLLRTGAIRELETELGGGDEASGKRWVAIAEASASGDYRALIELLVEQNRVVMSARGSASWLEVRADHFHVRFHEDRGDLPQRKELVMVWRHSYFLDALREVVRQIGDAT